MDKETFITLYLSLDKELRDQIQLFLIPELSEQIEQPLEEPQSPV